MPQDQRTGLLLMNGWVYAAFASHCDHQPYAGYVAGREQPPPTTTTLWTDEAGVSDDQAGIWQSGGGLMSDGSGRIFFTSGNGISPAKGPGDKPAGPARGVRGPAAAASPSGRCRRMDFFSPANAPKLDAGDMDFGAGGPVGLPFGTATYPDVVAQAGKYGTAVPAQPQQPRRPPAELRRRGRGPLRDRPPGRACGATPGSSATPRR